MFNRIEPYLGLFAGIWLVFVLPLMAYQAGSILWNVDHSWLAAVVVWAFIMAWIDAFILGIASYTTLLIRSSTNVRGR